MSDSSKFINKLINESKSKILGIGLDYRYYYSTHNFSLIFNSKNYKLAYNSVVANAECTNFSGFFKKSFAKNNYAIKDKNELNTLNRLASCAFDYFYYKLFIEKNYKLDYAKFMNIVQNSILSFNIPGNNMYSITQLVNGDVKLLLDKKKSPYMIFDKEISNVQSIYTILKESRAHNIFLDFKIIFSMINDKLYAKYRKTYPNFDPFYQLASIIMSYNNQKKTNRNVDDMRRITQEGYNNFVKFLEQYKQLFTFRFSIRLKTENFLFVYPSNNESIDNFRIFSDIKNFNRTSKMDDVSKKFVGFLIFCFLLRICDFANDKNVVKKYGQYTNNETVNLRNILSGLSEQLYSVFRLNNLELILDINNGLPSTIINGSPSK